MNILAEKLLELRNRALALPSLKPGDGYDLIGFELCDLVANTNMPYAQREEFFASLNVDYPDLLSSVQQISIHSEAEMDRAHAQKILQRLEDDEVRARIMALPQSERLTEILHEYPHGWIYARTREVQRLLGKTPDGLLLFGRSNLPLDALGFHLATNAPIIWADPHKDSATVAQGVIKALEHFGVIAPGNIIIKTVQSGETGFLQAGMMLMVLDDDLMTPELFHQAHKCRMPVITIDPLGLGKLLYPYTPGMRPHADLYERSAITLARHSHDEEIEAGRRYVAASPCMFLSLSLYEVKAA